MKWNKEELSRRVDEQPMAVSVAEVTGVSVRYVISQHVNLATCMNTMMSFITLSLQRYSLPSTCSSGLREGGLDDVPMPARWYEHAS
jgi:hypothetical protein